MRGADEMAVGAAIPAETGREQAAVEAPGEARSFPSLEDMVRSLAASTERAAEAAEDAAGAASRAAGVAELAAERVLRAQLREAVGRAGGPAPESIDLTDVLAAEGPAEVWLSQLGRLLEEASEARTQAKVEQERATRLQQELERERDRWQVDELTGVLTRRAGEERARIEIDRASRHASSLVCVFLDVEGLKATNDTFGHGAGDFALQTVASRLSSSLRGYDTVFRYGGDEFVCVIGEAPADMMRGRFDQITQGRLRVGKGAVGLSFGIAELQSGDHLEELVERADADMYARRREAAQRAAS